MSEKRPTRKLRAILSTDAVGYSRLMQEDEGWTIKAIENSKQMISDLVRRFNGRVVDAPGDNLLAEFASVVDAVECAIEIQAEMTADNRQLPAGKQLRFRIGINLGDVVQQNDRIYGDGVNIAARIEGLADPGGICISSTAYDHVKKKLAVGYELLGEHRVKNIAEPVRVYRISGKPPAAGAVIGAKWKNPKRKRRLRILASSAAVALAALVAGVWYAYLDSPPHTGEFVDRFNSEIPESKKPSIAVLPFRTIGGNLEQEYFSDGITNDIITDLSKFSQLFVIASNSVFVYKGRSVKAQQVKRELGARYILQGSVQKADDRMRVNAQLIDATSGHHLWAERYDRQLKGVFALQDEIVQRIVTTLAVKIDTEERARVMKKDTESLEAYDFVLRGWEYFSRSTRSANLQAREMFREAIAIDPRYATAYVGLGQTYITHFAYGWTEFSARALQKAHDLAQKALDLDEANALAHALLGEVYRYWMLYDLAKKEYERAIELNPNDAHSHAELGAIMNYGGQTERAIIALETALSFNPHMRPSNYMQLGLAYYLNRRHDEAIKILERGLSWYPDDVFIMIPLAAAYAEKGRFDDAARVARKIRRHRPFFEVDNYGTAFIDPSDRSKILEGLRKAGL
jgi:adenylate cyclase